MSTPTPTDTELLDLAREAAHHAWAPYSEFPVGAALLLDDGRVVTGCNVENASYGVGTCAERTAAARMIITGPSTAPDGHLPHPPRILAAAVVGLKAEPCYPCGACRQFLREFDCKRVIVMEEGEPRSISFEEILPHSFGPESL